MTETWHAAARVNFKHGDQVDVHYLEFTITHDELFSEKCPLCIFSRNHLVQLFQFLNDAWFVDRDSQSPNPSRTVWCMTGDVTNDELVSTLVGNFIDTIRAAHVKTIAFSDETGAISVYDVQLNKFIK